MTDQYYQIHQDRYRYILNQIRLLNLPPRAKILDIGCFPPHLFDSLTTLGYQVFGIASAHEPINNKQISILNIETDSFPYPENQFDLVLLSEVIEHLPNYPLPLLQKIRKILKPHGFLIITTPNVCRLHNLLFLLFGRNIYFSLEQMFQTSTSDATIYHRHNREYTLAELDNLLSLAGFSTSKANFFTAYTPWRPTRQFQPIVLAAKWAIYIATFLFPSRRDSLFLLSQPHQS